MMNITTVLDLKRAIRDAKLILIQVKFGCSEKWVKISKAEAKDMISELDANATPESFEMYSADFGSFEASSKTLYLG